MFLSIFNLSIWLFMKIQCIVDWCGRKGRQFVLLRLVACLFALFNFWCHWCLRKYITLCLNVITFCFSTELFCIFFPLFLAHGLTHEVGAIYVYGSTLSVLVFFFNFLSFTSILFYLYSFSRIGVRTLAFVFGSRLRNEWCECWYAGWIV